MKPFPGAPEQLGKVSHFSTPGKGVSWEYCFHAVCTRGLQNLLLPTVAFTPRGLDHV